MRDDIHRRLPISRAWKRVVRACSRDADQMQRPGAVTAALVAQAGDLRRSFLRDLETGLEASRVDMFPANMVASCVRPQGEAEDQLLRHCIFLANDRRLAGDVIREGLVEVLAAQGDAHVREIAGHLQLAAPRDATELLTRIEAACGQVDLDAVASVLLSGERSSRAAKAKIFDVDGELRAP